MIRCSLITLPFPLKTNGLLVFFGFLFSPYQYKCVCCGVPHFHQDMDQKLAVSTETNAWVAPKYGF
jgi:hypothetical protein